MHTHTARGGTRARCIHARTHAHTHTRARAHTHTHTHSTQREGDLMIIPKHWGHATLNEESGVSLALFLLDKCVDRIVAA